MKRILQQLSVTLFVGLTACTQPESKVCCAFPPDESQLPRVSLVPVQLNFDLHNRGSVAADCYVTQVSFSMPHRLERPIYPDTLAFKEQETGCVSEASERTGIFVQIAELDTQVWYETLPPHQAVLLLLKRTQSGQSRALYWRAVRSDLLLGKTLEELYELEDEYYPYRISQDERSSDDSVIVH